MAYQPAIDEAAELLVGGEMVAGREILILLPDRTRPLPLAHLLPNVAHTLLAAGAEEDRMIFAIASGTHVPDAKDHAALHGILFEPPLVLDPLPEDRMVSVGMTDRGTDVRVHPILLEADLVLSIDIVALHYFAGFGGGGKMLFPGLGAKASITSNHRLSLAPERGLAAGVEPGRTHDNPVALDLRQAHRMLPAVRHLTVIPSQEGFGMAVWSDYEEFDALCSRYADQCRVGDRHAADLVIAFAEGAVGIDVVQAHKALFHAALYARDGAEIVLFADCPEGTGSAALARWLTRPDRDRLERDARAAYDLNAQTAISLAAIAERTHVTWVSPNRLPELAPWGIEVTSDYEAIERRVGTGHAAGKAIVRLDHPTRCIPMS